MYASEHFIMLMCLCRAAEQQLLTSMLAKLHLELNVHCCTVQSHVLRYSTRRAALHYYAYVLTSFFLFRVRHCFCMLLQLPSAQAMARAQAMAGPTAAQWLSVAVAKREVPGGKVSYFL
jgi:hypothetical protein